MANTLVPKTFAQWLRNHADKPTPAGELARNWLNTQRCEAWRDEACLDYLLTGLAGPDYETHEEAIHLVATAVSSYGAYLKRWHE